VNLKINSDEVKSILAALDDLIEIKHLIRKIVPNYHLEESINKLFKNKLKDLQKNLDPLFTKYLEDDAIVSSKSSKMHIKESILENLKKDNIALVSANSSKKKLKNIGFDPRQIIVSGGPLFVEDYKLVNPDIPEETLRNIKKKCDRILNQIINENWNQKDLVFIFEKNNLTDKLILKRINDLSKLINKEIRTIELVSWNVLDEN